MKVEVSIDGFILKQRIVCLGALTALFSITIISGGILSSSIVTATDDSVVDEINITVPISCTLTGTGMNTHNAEIQNSQYESSIGETTLKAYCNDNNGFSIYAIGFTDDQYGKNVLTDASLGSDYDIITGTSTSGPTSNWAMKLSTITGPEPTYPIVIQNSFDDYHNVPSVYTMVAKRESGTDVGSSAEGSTLKTTYQAYVSSTQQAGTYTGQVKYTLVHPYTNTPKDGPIADCPANKICYSPGANDVVGTMGQQSIESSSTSATLLASNFSRTGYGFAGWSDVYDYDTNQNAHFYGPQEDITFTAGQYSTTNGGMRLYAVWVPSAGYFQNSSTVSELCGTGQNTLTQAPIDGTANLTSVSALTDQRDNQTYAIARLADGKCWMIENLRLENTNSDNSTGALAHGYWNSPTYGRFSGLANPENSGFSGTYSANSLYSKDGSNGTINISSTNSPGERMPRYNNSNTTNRASSPTTNNGPKYSYGNYYTWHAAVATLAFNATANSSIASTSLCPSGWRLPTGGSVTSSVNVTENPSTWREFYNLGYSVMGIVANDSSAGEEASYNSSTKNANGDTADKAFRKFPNNYLYSGYIRNASFNYRGSYGYYWSSTINNWALSYKFGLGNGDLNPSTNSNYKSYGYSVRCLQSSS